MEKEYGIYEQLAALALSDAYPFHMPGHKRNPKAGLPEGFAQLDITEIENFDNLHHAQGILQEAMRRAAALYGSRETYFLVNGSTCGILAAVSSVVLRGDTLILGRNAHMSAYHAAYLRGCRIASLYPEWASDYGIYGAVSPAETERMLIQHPEAKAVLITSPTYDGALSDIEEIAKIVHERGKILIVDEAHGAHFGLDPRLPKNSVQCGADMVIHSLHKTLPSLTQTALLHVNGERVDRRLLARFLRIYQSSSPSYLLMGSMDRCICQLQENREKWFDSFFEKRKRLLSELTGLKNLTVLSGNDVVGKSLGSDDPNCHCELDPGKMLVFCSGTPYTGKELQEILLRDYHLQMELAAQQYVLAILTVMDTDEGYARLAGALKEIDERIACAAQDNRRETLLPSQASPTGMTPSTDCAPCMTPPKDCAPCITLPTDCAPSMTSPKDCAPRMTPMQAMDESCTEPVALENTEGRIVAEFLYAYPPGVPILLPGEVMTGQMLKLLERYRSNGADLWGPADESLRTLRCVRETG